MRERCKLARCSVICNVGENQLSCVFLSSMVPLSVNRFIFLNLVIFLDNIPFLFFFVVNLSAGSEMLRIIAL
uniref:Uncharacterized protein n=1 Tax=Populus trichocarpa TaxID=3694 RepID=A0A2K1XQK7_POPTR